MRAYPLSTWGRRHLEWQNLKDFYCSVCTIRTYHCQKCPFKSFLNSTLWRRAHGNFHSVPWKSIALPCILSESTTHDYVTSFLVWKREQRASRITLNDPHLCCIQKQRLLTPNPKLKLACVRIPAHRESQPALVVMLTKGHWQERLGPWKFRWR